MGEVHAGLFPVLSPNIVAFRATCYLNAEPNERSLEWDMKTNLFADLPRERWPRQLGRAGGGGWGRAPADVRLVLRPGLTPRACGPGRKGMAAGVPPPAAESINPNTRTHGFYG